MRLNDMFPSKYLKAEDLDADLPVTIKSSGVETFKNRETGKDEEKMVVYFEGMDKGLLLNKTNFKAIVEATGQDDSDNWPGAKVVLTVIDVDAFGDVVAAIRVKQAKAANPDVQAFWNQVNAIGLTRSEGLEILKETKQDFKAALASLSADDPNALLESVEDPTAA